MLISLITSLLNTVFTLFPPHTIEIGTLGFMTDIIQFCKINLKNCMTDPVRSQIFLSVVTDSFMVYCNRNVIQARQ